MTRRPVNALTVTKFRNIDITRKTVIVLYTKNLDKTILNIDEDGTESMV